MKSDAMTSRPTADALLLAAERIKPYVHRTPVLTSDTLNRLYKTQLFFKCENFQKVGAFKARGAVNAVLSLSTEERLRGVATHSSGNHAQALSWAATMMHTTPYVVMPENSTRVKIDAVHDYGGRITFCKPTLEARETTLEEVIRETGANEIHSYNDARIIAGQGTSAMELMDDVSGLDLLLSPVGGGGLLSGTALAAHYFHPHIKVIAAEPEQAGDACLSFHERTFYPSVNPQTIADGLRTSLGSLTFPIILDHVSDIVTVTEQGIINAMLLIWERMKIIVEPSSAVPFAAIMENKIDVSGKKVGIIISGGNVELNNLPWIHHE